MKLNDKRTPTCPHCGMAKLETEDIIDTYTNYEGHIFVEYTIGVCPNCERHFQYNQIYTLEPTGYEDIDYCDEDEIEEEED
jgi:hypothetical protein